MTELLDPLESEKLVGARRHAAQHLGRVVTGEGGAGGTVYILHSQKCLDLDIDLRRCPWSLALDRGLDGLDWEGYLDRVVVLAFVGGRLFPVVPSWVKDLEL